MERVYPNFRKILRKFNNYLMSVCYKEIANMANGPGDGSNNGFDIRLFRVRLPAGPPHWQEKKILKY